MQLFTTVYRKNGFYQFTDITREKNRVCKHIRVSQFCIPSALCIHLVRYNMSNRRVLSNAGYQPPPDHRRLTERNAEHPFVPYTGGWLIAVNRKSNIIIFVSPLITVCLSLAIVVTPCPPPYAPLPTPPLTASEWYLRAASRFCRFH